MHHDIEAHLSVHGFVTRPQILDCGFDDRAISAALRAGELARIGPGLYAAGPLYRSLDTSAKHLLRAKAASRRLGSEVVFSHQTAALIHDLPVWGVDLDHIQGTRLDDGRGRHQAGVAHHTSRLDPSDIGEVDGLLVVSPARAVWDLAVAESTESGLVTADAALNRGLVDDDDLRSEAVNHADWRRARHAKMTLSLTDSGAESPGETRVRWAFRVAGLPRPETQIEVFDDSGALVGRSDLGWREARHLVEFDGMLKYRATAGDPEAASRAVQAEKRREDAIRSLGWGVSRVVWSELSGQVRIAMLHRVRRDLERSRRYFTA